MNHVAANPRILVAGIGNIFHGDDGFGSEVARRLIRLNWPEEVKIVDYGIRGIDLVYALMESPEVAILIDASPQQSKPGSLCVLELDVDPSDQEGSCSLLLDGHGLNPLAVLRQVRVLGGVLPRMLLVGCEPADLGGDEGHLGLSQPVRAAVAEAMDVIESLVRALLAAKPGRGSDAAGTEVSGNDRQSSNSQKGYESFAVEHVATSRGSRDGRGGDGGDCQLR